MWSKRLSANRLLAGDWLILAVSSIMVVGLFKSLWSHQPASRLQIRQGNHVYGIYDLNQQRSIHIQGPLGISDVQIENGKARFKHSPCTNQYCVHQGWLRHAGQVTICLPNQISLELLGSIKPYDSLNY